MHIEENGLLAGARYLASPNCDDRPPGTAIDLIVIHNISLPPGVFGGAHIAAFFCNRLDPAVHPYFATIAAQRVSAHFLVGRDGAIVQFVPCHRRAWHAGVSHWRGRDRCNDFSIGIELEGADDVAFEAIQYEQLARLAEAIRRRHPIRDIAGHSEIAPDRKTDPGPAFDWPRFSAALDR